MSIDEDYYKPIIAKSAFDGGCIQYESKGDKGKIYRYFNTIKPYLSDIINDHKSHGLVRYHSGDKTWLEETSSEWKIELTMAINFFSSEDFDKTGTMHAKSNNVEIMFGRKQMKFLRTFLNPFCKK